MAYQYILTQNRASVLLGPMFWRPRMFQAELDTLHEEGELAEQCSLPTQEQGYLLVNPSATFEPQTEFWPILSVVQPELDPLSEQLAGPTYTYDDVTKGVTQVWAITNKALPDIRANLIGALADIRYSTKEIVGAKVVIQGQTVTVDTSRDGRNIFVQSYLLLPDTGTMGWKFPECWLTISKAELGQCVEAGVAWVQGAFAWEQAMTASINAAMDVPALKALEAQILPPAPSRQLGQ